MRHCHTFFSNQLAAKMEAAADAGGDRDTSDIYRNGFQEIKKLLPQDLVDKLLKLSKVKQGKRPISEASQKDVIDESLKGTLAKAVREHRGGAVLALVQSVFRKAKSFEIETPSLLTAAPGNKPQIPHADHHCNAAIFAIVQLKGGQDPTLCHQPFQIDSPFPTWIPVRCCDCNAFWPLTDAQLRDGVHLRIAPGALKCANLGKVCSVPESVCTGGEPKRQRLHGRATRSAVNSAPKPQGADLEKLTKGWHKGMTEAFAPLLADGAPDLCVTPCSTVTPENPLEAGDCTFALATLLHRGPGCAEDATEDRSVLFFTITPVYDVVNVHPNAKYNPNYQIHASHLLNFVDTEIREDTEKRVKEMYEEKGYNLDFFND